MCGSPYTWVMPTPLEKPSAPLLFHFPHTQTQGETDLNKLRSPPLATIDGRFYPDRFYEHDG
ncbi:hypothetical protein HanPI659440_Chr12g0451771 [Helianthus annuus]|nr:hypothetical protein HanPI659440_Chr12g0451771 [Helianthus annuus]